MSDDKKKSLSDQIRDKKAKDDSAGGKKSLADQVRGKQAKADSNDEKKSLAETLRDAVEEAADKAALAQGLAMDGVESEAVSDDETKEEGDKSLAEKIREKNEGKMTGAGRKSLAEQIRDKKKDD